MEAVSNTILPPAAACQSGVCDCAKHSGTHTAPVRATAKIVFRIGLCLEPASEKCVPITAPLFVLRSGPMGLSLADYTPKSRISPLLGNWPSTDVSVIDQSEL